jgi:hypothetical protein
MCSSLYGKGYSIANSEPFSGRGIDISDSLVYPGAVKSNFTNQKMQGHVSIGKSRRKTYLKKKLRDYMTLPRCTTTRFYSIYGLFFFLFCCFLVQLDSWYQIFKAVCT